MWLANNRIFVILESQFGGWFWLGGTYFAFWVRTKDLFRPLKKFDKFAMALLCSLNAFQTKHLTNPSPWIIKKCLRVLNSTFSYWSMYKNCIMVNFFSSFWNWDSSLPSHSVFTTNLFQTFCVGLWYFIPKNRFSDLTHVCEWSLWIPWAVKSITRRKV